MRQRYLWIFPVCCQLLARLSNELFKETLKWQCYKITALCQSLCSSKAGPVSFCVQVEPQRKMITGFPQLWFFFSGYLFPPIITHVPCTVMDSSLELSTYVFIQCVFFQYKPITWVQERGKPEMVIWCVPKRRPSWFTIWHSLLLRVDFLCCTNSEGGGHSLQ